MGNSLQKHRDNLQQEEDADHGNFTCEICFEPMSATKKFKKSNHCAHPFCQDCIAKYIQVKLEDFTATIQCPGLNCQQALDPLSCTAIISQSVFAKWCDVLCDNYVLGFERSFCPNRNCRELVVNECGGTVNKCKCPHCKRLFCFQCKVAWHAGYGCEESRNMRDHNDILFGQLAERRAWIKCPGCGYFIERMHGCNSILCRCHTRFCYKCGKVICECGRFIHFPYLYPLYLLIMLLVFVALLCLWINGILSQPKVVEPAD